MKHVYFNLIAFNIFLQTLTHSAVYLLVPLNMLVNSNSFVFLPYSQILQIHGYPWLTFVNMDANADANFLSRTPQISGYLLYICRYPYPQMWMWMWMWISTVYFADTEEDADTKCCIRVGLCIFYITSWKVMG